MRNNENYEMESEITDGHIMSSIECDDQPSEDNEFNDKLVSSAQNLLPKHANTTSPITEAMKSTEVQTLGVI